MKKEKIITFLDKEAVICFDTNVFLNIYEYNPHIADFYVELSRKVLEQMILPDTVEREFRDNHRECKGRQSKKFNSIPRKFATSIDSSKAKMVKQFDILSDFEFPNVDRLRREVLGKLQEMTDIVDEYVEENEVVEEMTRKFTDEDSVADLVRNVIERNRKLNPFDLESIYKICGEGDSRYKDEIPPGYKDAKDKSGLRMFNDLIIWKEVIEYCKKNNKDLIFVTDDVKPDWYHLSGDQKGEFREELISEFKNDTGQSIIGTTSKIFFEAVAKKFGIEIPSLVESVLDFDIENYVAYLIDDSFEDKILDNLFYSGEDFINIESLSYYGGYDFEYDEIHDLNYVRCEFQGCFDNVAKYVLEFFVKATISTREYWGRDDETKELILSDRYYSDIEGTVLVELYREVDTYIDSITQDYDYKGYRIIQGNLREVIAYQSDDLCVQCGRNIGVFPHYLDGMVCEDCAVTDSYGEMCPICGRKVPAEDMAGNGFCIDCTAENPDL